jgi:hypothetical protein
LLIKELKRKKKLDEKLGKAEIRPSYETVVELTKGLAK